MAGISDLFKSPVQSAISGVIDGASAIIKDFRPTPDSVIAANSRLKELQINAQTTSDQLSVQLADIHQKDVDSARTANSAIVTSANAPKFDKILPYILAGLVTIGFFGILAYMLKYTVPSENRDTMNILLGSLGTAWLSVINFYFGSSSSSRAKDETIKSLSS